MTTLFGIGFSTPWILLGLAALPLLWLLLRAVPPAPRRRVFPAVTLLAGLKDDDSVTDRTPWWLILLRMLVVAAAIIGLAGPVLNPSRDLRIGNPVLVVLDASWAGAADWRDTLREVERQVLDIGRAGQPVALLRLTQPEQLSFQSANVWQRQIAGLQPQPWQPTAEQIATASEQITGLSGAFDTLWVSDGLDYAGRADLAATLATRGDLRVLQMAAAPMALRPAQFEDGAILLTALRTAAGQPMEVTLVGRGPDPGGTMRVLSTAEARFAAETSEASARLILPSELRARITRFEIQGLASAGAVALTDDSLRRREIALISSQTDNEGLPLLSQLHYLRQALAPTADLFEGTLADLLPANPDVVILADVAQLAPADQAALVAWIEQGGMLLRFSGPRLAASDISRLQEDPLMPVRLRSGGRTIGGALSWGQPKQLAPFDEGSPFFGLSIPEEVSVRSQVVAQPDPDLANRVIAALRDGTPLVTRKAMGQGQVVLFHVTANADWSNLPLSGLFVDMLERLAVSTAAKPPAAQDLVGTTWAPIEVLDGFGRAADASALPGVDGSDILSADPGPGLRPGLYDSGSRKLARNVLTPDSRLTAARWPASVPVTGAATSVERPLAGLFLGAALVLLLIDIFASLLVSGHLQLRRATLGLLLGMAMLLAQGGQAPLQAQAVSPLTLSSELALAYVLTRDDAVDDVSAAGLRGLSNSLLFRTSVEPAPPVGVDLERDELAFYPLLYWPITPDQPLPSTEAYARLNAYLQTGGMILFDTRDANLASTGASSPNGRRLQQLARPLDVPPLEPVPADHVLTRTFYLLQDFPGRHSRGAVWVEAAPPDAEQIDGMPFRNLNDGVTPIVVGGNDWAAAWAVDSNGRPMFPVGRGFAGERQRELAYRFGVNLVMHVLTGNYKSDQVHVPALLDRLGQ